MKNQFLAFSFTVLAGSLLASPAMASQIGPAGCGLGNQVFKKDNQVLAATTNGTSGNQTFGITSGTSGCTDSAATAQMTIFVESNKIALSKEAARGQGETIEALAGLMGCGDSKSVGQELKAKYAEIFGATADDSGAVVRSIQNAVRGNQQLASSCQSLG